ncbi:mucin-2 isoform X3 [Takifugu flavidus]|uniref:mucin-2 isoform X3 n=1 Tax=Takifugu flavidus TaxID=433684 RepID=UPI0025447BDA|nr:mucin-2 isoform X3 [Takifugu flavidus]
MNGSIFCVNDSAMITLERHDERLGGNFLRENRHFSQIPNGHPWHPSAIRREDTHKAGLLAAPPLRQPEAACCSQSQLPAQPVRSRFTSSLFFRLGCNLKDPCLHSSTVTSRADTDGVLCQVNGHTEAVTSAASDRPPAEKKDVNGLVCRGGVSPREREELRMIPAGPQLRTGTTSVDRQGPLGCSADPSTEMLSSTVVTVLAPHRSGRQRRFKRSEENGISEAHDGTNGGQPPSAGTRGQVRTPFSSTRQNTVGCTTTVDYESRRKMTQTASLDVNSARMEKREAAATNPLSPLSLEPPDRRATPQTGLQGGPPLSLKPTSSSLLLSLRRSNCNDRNTINAAPTLSEKNLLSQRTPDHNGQAHQEGPSISYRTDENGPVCSPPSSRTHLLSASPTIRGTPFTQQAQANISADSSPRHVARDHYPLIHPVPRRTTLTSTSWWKQVSQDCGAPLTATDAFNNNTLLASPRKVQSDFASPSRIDTSWLGDPVHNNRAINHTTPALESCMKTQDGTRNLTQTKNEASTHHKSELAFKQQFETSSNIKEALKCHSLPGVSPGSKISRAAEQTTSKGFTKIYINNGHSAANASELQPPLLTATSCDPISWRYPKYSQASSHHTVPQTFTKPSASISTNTREASSSLPVTSDTASVPSHSNIQASSNGGVFLQTPKLSRPFNTSPLGFERSYASIPFHPKPVSTLIPTVSAYPKTSYSPVPTASTTPPHNRSGPATACSTSPLSPSVAPALPSTPTTITSSLLTPPATPIISSPSYSGSMSPNEGRTLSSSLEKDSKNKNARAEGKKARRVTWEDSVDVQQSQKGRAGKAEQAKSPADTPPSRPSVSPKAPSIFNLLRSSNPSANASPVCSRTPKISSILVGKPGKYRSLSSDSADLASRRKETFELTPSDCTASNQGRHTLTTSRHERTLSLESGTAHLGSSGSLSLPPELSYKHRYTSPPYTALMSTRTAQKEAKVPTPRLLLTQQPLQPNNYGRLSTPTDPTGRSAFPVAKPVQSPIGPPQPQPSPFQTKASTSDRWGASGKDQDNKNHNGNKYQDHQNGQILPVNSRVEVIPQSHGSLSTLITETLVYSIKPKTDVSTSPKIPLNPVGHPANPPVSQESQLSPRPALGRSNRAEDLPDQDSNGNSLTGPQTPEDENSKKGSREGLLGKSRFFSMETSNEQIQKRGRFALKRSTSTPNANLSRSDSDRSNKTNNKMDQMVNRLKKTFSTRRSEDDLSFPWKWRRTSQTPSVSGSSEASSVSVAATDSPKSVATQEQELPSKEKEAEDISRWTPPRSPLTPPSENTKAGGGVCSWSGKSSPKESSPTEQMCVNQPHNPTTHHFDHFLSCSDAGPGRRPVSPAGKSTPSPRSPFSPFPSLSPVSSIPSSDVTDDVFYSPKLPRRREPASPCEPGEGFSLAGLRRGRVSTGPLSSSPSLEPEYSSCADLKYGIEPGRSYSVSSILSSRPSGPGRISTGSRVMSVGNLCESALTYAGKHQDLDLLLAPDWARVSKGFQMYCANGPSKIRSRSLPRSLTKCLSSWNSGETLMAKPGHFVGPNISVSHFTWDAGGPPTPPPTPPLSPVSRQMSKPPSLSSPIFPVSPIDGPSRGHLPARGRVSRLGTFEEFSDNSSETTTDDEYYLETSEEEEKETEL